MMDREYIGRDVPESANFLPRSISMFMLSRGRDDKGGCCSILKDHALQEILNCLAGNWRNIWKSHHRGHGIWLTGKTNLTLLKMSASEILLMCLFLIGYQEVHYYPVIDDLAMA